MRFATVSLVLMSALALAACGKKPLHNLDARPTGPDEFLVLPGKPLEQPASFAALPEPTPGGSNITDRDPRAEAVAALGGRSSAGQGVGADGALVSAASRHGVEPGIRTTLAEEDAKRRKRAGFLANVKLFPVDRYAETYERETLNPYRVQSGYTRAGVPTPSAPPADE